MAQAKQPLWPCASYYRRSSLLLVITTFPCEATNRLAPHNYAQPYTFSTTEQLFACRLQVHCLCPPIANTNILQSGRNRPQQLHSSSKADLSPEAAEAAALASKQMARFYTTQCDSAPISHIGCAATRPCLQTCPQSLFGVLKWCCWCVNPV